jgi:hypothetical protein
MKVKDIVDKIFATSFEVWDKDGRLYTNDTDCRLLCTEEENYNSCKNREVDYVTIENHTKYTKNNGITVYPTMIICVI